jgi:hypothetical protein
MGEVGHFRCLRGEAPFALRPQPGAHLLYELTSANVADVSLTEELLAEAKLGEEVARRGYSEISPTAAKNRGKPWPRWASSFGDRAVRAATRGVRQHIEIAISSSKRVFSVWARRWWGWRAGSRPRSAPTPPTRSSWLTGAWIVLKAASRSCGLEPDNRHLVL